MEQGEGGGLICLYWTRNTKSNNTAKLYMSVCVPLHFKLFWCGPTVFFSYVVAQNHIMCKIKQKKMWAAAAAAAVSYFGHA